MKNVSEHIVTSLGDVEALSTMKYRLRLAETLSAIADSTAKRAAEIGDPTEQANLYGRASAYQEVAIAVSAAAA